MAYFGKGGARLLPLPEGSRLVVDASEAAVKAGQTDPRELSRLLNRGVSVYSRPGLHAKVFALDDVAFVGSTNISRRSRDTLLEALIETKDLHVIHQVRSFVREHCLDDLGPKELARLARLYREPKVPRPAANRRASARVPRYLPRVRLVQLMQEDPPKLSHATMEVGERAARKRMTRPRLHVSDTFHWRGMCPFERGDIIVQVVDQDDGRMMVYPAGKVIGRRIWKRGRQRVTFVYLEAPRKRCISLDRLAKVLGRGARKRLQRGGRVRWDFAEKLLLQLGMQDFDSAW